MSTVLPPTIISRIAPTPSGYLHAGNAFSFVLSWLLVRKSGGRLALRIDDNDASRFRPEYLEDIFASLEWLGLDYDLGPQGPDDFYQNYSQLKRRELYESWLGYLQQLDLVYACRCSRRQVQDTAVAGLYGGTCRELKLRYEPDTALRLFVEENASVELFDLLQGKIQQYPAKQMGDFVLKRKDSMIAYQLVSLVEDMCLGTNLLIRGADLLESSFAQKYLAQLLSKVEGLSSKGLNNFRNAAFLHHPLLLDEQGNKLSKSADSRSLLSMRQAGKNPRFIFRRLAEFLALPVEAGEDLPTLIASLSPEHPLLKNFFQHMRKLGLS